MGTPLPRALQEYLRQPHGSVPELIRINAREMPRRIALTDALRSLDYAALDALMDRVAFGLHRDGLRTGDVVVLCAAPSAHYVAILLGAVRAGMAVAPVTAPAMAELSGVLQARAVFVDGSCTHLYGGLGFGLPTVSLDGGPTGQSFSEWLPPASGAAFEGASPDPEQPFFIICSSGTTGGAKGVVQSHDLRWKYVTRASAFGYAPDATALVSTPLHSNTSYASLLCTLTHGGHAIIQAPFEPAEYLRLAALHRVTHTVLVPVMYEKILSHPAFSGTDLSSFRMKLCTSAPFRASLKREVVARWPGDLIELYGMTEGGGNCLLQAHIDARKLHTVGRPGPTSDIRIINDMGQELPSGQRGEVVGHSPAMMSGYYRRADLTEACEWRDAAGKRFIRTGDIGQLDSEGYLTIFDRKSDVIESQGVRIYPSEIEAMLREHPDVADAAVVGAPDEQGEQGPVAFVCARPGVSTDTAQILRWCNARLASYLWVSRVLAVDELPRSAIGKVLKRELRTRCLVLEAQADRKEASNRNFEAEKGKSMLVSMLKSKLHRVKVTHCELHYEGSCAIDEDLIEASGLFENEQVHIWNIDNGERFVTYVIRGARGSGVISLNGSAARRAQIGDRVIIASFGSVPANEVNAVVPKLVFVDERNRITTVRSQVPLQS